MQNLELPPYDLEAERCLLGAIMFDPNKLDDVVDIVNHESFYLHVHAAIFTAAKTLQREGVGIDAMVVSNKLEAGGMKADEASDLLVSCVQSVPHAAHAVHYAKIVSEKAARRNLIYGIQDAIRDARDPITDIDTTLSQVESKVHSVVEQRTARTCTDFSTTLLDLQELIDNGTTQGLQVGFFDLDEMTRGLQPGNFVILAARPSMGKTSFAGNVFFNVAKSGEPVLFLSLEQSRLELAERMLSLVTGYPSEQLRAKHKFDLDFGLIIHKSNELSQMPLILDDTPGQTVSQIAARTRIQRRKRGIKLLVIDYLQLIDPEDRRQPREQQVASITRSLKLLARSLEIPIIALAQLNRQVESRADKRPVLSDLRESGAIEQDADMVWFLNRPVVYDESAPPTYAELIVAKHRNGRVGTVKLHWEGSTTSFKSAAREFQ